MAAAGEADDLSLVAGDAPQRWQQRVGLMPRDGRLGAARRALFWLLVAWLPVAAWAWWSGRALPRQDGAAAAEPLLLHFGIHARLLIGVPLLIIAEQVAQNVMLRLFPQFVHAGLVRPPDVPRFRAILAKPEKWMEAACAAKRMTLREGEAAPFKLDGPAGGPTAAR